ncbi:MAG: phosphoribosylformylglycinamidine cyclo-ligase [Planctomycetota bacterium]
MSTITYKQAGVDIEANTRWVAAIKRAMQSTHGRRVCDRRHGGFAGLFRLEANGSSTKRRYRKPILVGCTDGVGTKVLLAVKMDRLSTIGIDLVAMNVNDLITCGAEPLFFLDYLATHKLDPKRLLSVLEGIAEGCREAGCALLGGETAEMPDLYKRGDIDLAGFAVGVVSEDQIIDGRNVKVGDVMIGLPSSGVHSNGYSLVRKLIAKKRLRLEKEYDELGEPLGEALLRPTRIYVRAIRDVLGRAKSNQSVTAMAHITGGGLKENIARVLPEDCDAVVDSSTWSAPAIFEFLQRIGVTRAEMFKVFNMGIGYVLIVRPGQVGEVMGVLQKSGENPLEIGVVVKGKQKVLVRSKG